MLRKWAIRIPLFFLAIIILATIVLGLVETDQFSAYAACRKAVMDNRPSGYGVWKHEGTFQMVFVSRINFSDDINDFACEAVGIGPFWTAKIWPATIVGCFRKNGVSPCPEGYFGVTP
jgi:hypothetical protein